VTDRDCRACAGPLTEVLNLGDQRLSDFRTDDEVPPAYPLRLMHCGTCTLLQLAETTSRELMYHDRYGFRSGVNEAIRADLADIVHTVSRWRYAQRWLDIASNDGTLLSMAPPGAHRAGVDPVVAFAAEAGKYAHRIVPDYFHPKHFPGETFDVITSVSMFYDLDDPGAFVDGVAQVLDDNGIWVIQQNYAASMLAFNAFDNISHEHVTYFTLTALVRLLAKHGLEVNEVTLSDVNGGCLRTVVSHARMRKVGSSVAAHLALERAAGLDQPETWSAWGDKVGKLLTELRLFIERINSAGERIWIYGASTRGGTIWQAAGLTREHLPYAVERQPGKVGKKIASLGIPIISEEQMRADPPEYLLVSPWFFRDVFLERERDYLNGGGQLVFPLPHLEVVGA
jgi:NDP-4-keto-2,6-dideoxyhexose 3-C-methyltransferase